MYNKHGYFTFETPLSNSLSDYSNTTSFIPQQNLYKIVITIPIFRRGNRFRSKVTSRVTHQLWNRTKIWTCAINNKSRAISTKSQGLLLTNIHRSLSTLDMYIWLGKKIYKGGYIHHTECSQNMSRRSSTERRRVPSTTLHTEQVLHKEQMQGKNEPQAFP